MDRASPGWHVAGRKQAEVKCLPCEQVRLQVGAHKQGRLPLSARYSNWRESVMPTYMYTLGILVTSNGYTTLLRRARTLEILRATKKHLHVSPCWAMKVRSPRSVRFATSRGAATYTKLEPSKSTNNWSETGINSYLHQSIAQAKRENE